MVAQARVERFVPSSNQVHLWFCHVDKFTQYICLPPADVPYILRVSLEAGTPASRNGVFKTNFPLDGGVFNRNEFVERK